MKNKKTTYIRCFRYLLADMSKCHFRFLRDILIHLSLRYGRKCIGTGLVDLGAHLHGLVGGLIHEGRHLLVHAGLLQLMAKAHCHSTEKCTSLLNH